MAKKRNLRPGDWCMDTGFEVHGLPPCFPRGISFGDTDLETEVNGHFLNVEFKLDVQMEDEGMGLSKGQMLTNKAKLRDNRTVLFVWGEAPYTVTHMQHFGYEDAPRPATIQDFWGFCKQWGDWAGTAYRPNPRHSGFRYRVLREAADIYEVAS